MTVSKLEIVPIRDAFPHEAHNFTVWLEENIDSLSGRIGFDLTVLEREKAVGSFNVDLFCETSNGDYAIIENQLEKSDHDHLGKLLTYMVNLDARTAIWVAPELRSEHQRVIDWLNESTSDEFSFYLIRIEAVRIDDSPYAPLFTVLAGPDAQIREIGETKKELAGRHQERFRFWTEFLEKSRARTQVFANISPTTDYWLGTGMGKSGVQMMSRLLKDSVIMELYIDAGNWEQNKRIFDSLHNQKASIEREIGEPLDWRRLDEYRASRILSIIDSQGSSYEPEKWPRLQDLMIDAAIRFDKAFRGRLRKINI